MSPSPRPVLIFLVCLSVVLGTVSLVLALQDGGVVSWLNVVVFAVLAWLGMLRLRRINGDADAESDDSSGG